MSKLKVTFTIFESCIFLNYMTIFNKIQANQTFKQYSTSVFRVLFNVIQLL